MSEETWIVIAGSFRQSEEARIVRGVRPRQWVYTGHLGTLRGRVFTEDQIIMVGDWWNRVDLSRIMAEINVCMVRTTAKGE